MMESSALQTRLNLLIPSTLTRMTVDLLAGTLGFVLDRDHPPLWCPVVFEGVWAFAFVDGRDGNTAPMPPPQDASVRAIQFAPAGFGTFVTRQSSDPATCQAVSSANFLVVLEHGQLFIEAAVVAISRERFEIGYPELAEPDQP